MDNHGHKEKRSSPRVKRNITIQYRIQELPAAKEVQLSVLPYTDITHTTNLGERGLFFTAAHPIPAGSLLAVTLRLPTHPEGTFKITGRVVECKEGEKKVLYGVRVEFINLQKEEEEALKKFVQTFLPEK